MISQCLSCRCRKKESNVSKEPRANVARIMEMNTFAQKNKFLKLNDDEESLKETTPEQRNQVNVKKKKKRTRVSN